MPNPVVAVDTVIAAQPTQVWQAMQKGAMFPGTTIETDWQVGHPIVFTGEWEGKQFTDRGEIRTLSEPSEMSFTHWSDKDGSGERPASYHLVKYDLQPADEGTRVTLSQFNEGQDTAIDENTKAEYRKNWTMMLNGLKQTVEGVG